MIFYDLCVWECRKETFFLVERKTKPFNSKHTENCHFSRGRSFIGKEVKKKYCIGIFSVNPLT
jgi:hypothetical protein